MATSAGSTNVATPSRLARCASVAHPEGQPVLAPARHPGHPPGGLSPPPRRSPPPAPTSSPSHCASSSTSSPGATWCTRARRPPATRTSPQPANPPAACCTTPRRRNPVGSGLRDAFAPGPLPGGALPAPMFAPGANPSRSLRSLHCVFRVRPLRRGSAPSTPPAPPGPAKGVTHAARPHQPGHRRGPAHHRDRPLRGGRDPGPVHPRRCARAERRREALSCRRSLSTPTGPTAASTPTPPGGSSPPGPATFPSRISPPSTALFNRVTADDHARLRELGYYLPSLSVGDVIVLGSDTPSPSHHLVAAIGFSPISAEEYAAVRASADPFGAAEQLTLCA